LLYVYRVLLTGIHLTRTENVEANLMRLNDDARRTHVTDMIVRKLACPEQSVLQDSDLKIQQREYERLRGELESAHQSSALPEAPTTRGALNDLMVRLRTEPTR
jgi:predicted nucleotidyltransferase